MSTIGQRFAYWERVRAFEEPVRPVEVTKEGPLRSNKARVRWFDGEYELGFRVVRLGAQRVGHGRVSMLSGEGACGMQRSGSIALSRNRAWRLVHSLWIGWTFTLGFFSWLAFAYIGIRTGHHRWLLWAAVYAAPLTLFGVFSEVWSESWTNVALSTTILLGVVSIVHAFLVRKEYLLRLDLAGRETSNVSITSRGRRWEMLHSLWIGWTLFFGFTSWVAFLYIGVRAGRVRWVLWGLVYLAIFASFAISDGVVGQGNDVTQALIGLTIISWFFSVVHAFAVRPDYLVRLENREHASIEDRITIRRSEAEKEDSATELSNETDPESSREAEPEAAQPSSPEIGKSEDIPAAPSVAPPTAQPSRAPVRPPEGPTPESIESHTHSVSDFYPLPVAYGWSLLESFWDPRDRYREQLRHAENMLAYLGSVSLALLDKEDYAKAQIDLKIPWQGGISFGAWKLIVTRCAKAFRSYKDHPLAYSIHKLKISTETKGFGADVAALIRARNDFHHGRGPLTEEEIAQASEEAQLRLQRCMEAVSFLADYPIRLVQDFDVDRRGGTFVLKCLRLMGDGPGFRQEKVEHPEALPRGDLFLNLGDRKWVPLYPFIVASNCPHCRYRETYFVDHWNDRKNIVLLKSFERGHTEEKRDISEALTALTAEQGTRA